MATKAGKKSARPKTRSKEAATKRRLSRDEQAANTAQQLASLEERATGFVEAARRKLGLTRRKFSRLTGYSERAIANWEGGGVPDEPALRRIRELERFRAKLAEVVRPDQIPKWLDAPNEAFDGLKPIEVIERGEIDRLWNMIFYLESGVAS